MRLQVSSYGSPYIIKFFPCSYICAVRFTFVNSAFWFEFDHNKRMDNSQKCFMEFDLAGRALPIISQITTASAVLGSLWVLKSRLFTHPNFGYRADLQKHDEPFCFLPCAKSEHNIWIRIMKVEEKLRLLQRTGEDSPHVTSIWTSSYSNWKELRVKFVHGRFWSAFNLGIMTSTYYKNTVLYY